MLPILQIGPLALPVPQLSYLLAFWLGLSLGEKIAVRRGFPPDALFNLSIIGLITGLVFARITYIFQYTGAFIQSPISMFSLNPGLLEPTSGLTFAILGMLIYTRQSKLNLVKTLDALTPVLAVMAIGIALAHIGSGEGFGSETTLPWAINLWGANRHPSQFYELTAAVVILSITITRAKSGWMPGKLFMVFIGCTAGANLFLEAFRGDSNIVLGGLRVGQVLSWLILSAALFGLEFLKRNTHDEGVVNG